jgi:hypothetical protein
MDALKILLVMIALAILIPIVIVVFVAIGAQGFGAVVMAITLCALVCFKK